MKIEGWGWWLPTGNRWNIGMVEIWNIGYETRSSAGGLISDEAHLYEIDRIPPNPVFQHSSTPTLRQHINAGINYLGYRLASSPQHLQAGKRTRVLIFELFHCPNLFRRYSSPKSIFNSSHMGKWSDICRLRQ